MKKYDELTKKKRKKKELMVVTQREKLNWIIWLPAWTSHTWLLQGKHSCSFLTWFHNCVFQKDFSSAILKLDHGTSPFTICNATASQYSFTWSIIKWAADTRVLTGIQSPNVGTLGTTATNKHKDWVTQHTDITNRAITLIQNSAQYFVTTERIQSTSIHQTAPLWPLNVPRRSPLSEYHTLGCASLAQE